MTPQPQTSQDINSKENLLQSVSNSQEETRSRIAWLFTKVFLALVALSLAAPATINMLAPDTFPNPTETSKNLVTLITSVLGGPFGFIVGFYFKQSSD